MTQRHQNHRELDVAFEFKIEYILFMGSTTVHIPDNVLKRIDAIARRRGTSRNRVVLASLEAEIARDAGVWPDSFFVPPADAERAELVEATRRMEDDIAGSRRNRGAVIL